MSPSTTTDDLVQLVHRYYPSGMEKDDPRYPVSEEARRLDALLRTHENRTPAWDDFVRQLGETFPDCLLLDTTVPKADPCYSCRISLPGFVTGAPVRDFVVCLLSQLAPVYTLYASHVDRRKYPEVEAWLRFPPFPPEFHAHAARLAHLIESTFGFTHLSKDVLFTPVPDLVPKTVNYPLGDARLIDCLFTEHRY